MRDFSEANPIFSLDEAQWSSAYFEAISV